MPIHTSRIFYGRGIPKNYNNFAFIAQANNTIPVPISSYLQNYTFYNRNNNNNVNNNSLWLWRI